MVGGVFGLCVGSALAWGLAPTVIKVDSSVIYNRSWLSFWLALGVFVVGTVCPLH